MIEDLCYILGIDPEKIMFELHKDSRDIYGMPFTTQGKPFETETEINEDKYTIHIANSIAKRPNRLVFNLIHELIKIYLIKSNLEFDTGEDTNLFLTIAAIYFGFGIPITQNLTDKGMNNNGFWETK